MNWNFNLDLAPKGTYRTASRILRGVEYTYPEHVPENIIAAGNEGVVTVSRWLPKEERWNMFTKDVPPLAWMPWPKHPGEKS